MYVFEYKCLILGECKCCKSQSFSVREKLRPDPDQSAGLIKLHAWLYQGKHCTASGAFPTTREVVVTTNKDTRTELFQMFGEENTLWVMDYDEVKVTLPLLYTVQ